MNDVDNVYIHLSWEHFHWLFGQNVRWTAMGQSLLESGHISAIHKSCHMAIVHVHLVNCTLAASDFSSIRDTHVQIAITKLSRLKSLRLAPNKVLTESNPSGCSQGMRW